MRRCLHYFGRWRFQNRTASPTHVPLLKKGWTGRVKIPCPRVILSATSATERAGHRHPRGAARPRGGQDKTSAVAKRRLLGHAVYTPRVARRIWLPLACSFETRRQELCCSVTFRANLFAFFNAAPAGCCCFGWSACVGSFGGLHVRFTWEMSGA